jgi:hypothetical protein
VWCVRVAVLRGGERWRYACKRRCFLFLLNLVLSMGNIMLPIEDLMVDGGCIATTGGRRLFCIYIYIDLLSVYVLAIHRSLY